MSSEPQAEQPTFAQQKVDDRPHFLPTVHISAPCDVFQGNRDAFWTFQSKHRRNTAGFSVDLSPTSVDSENFADTSASKGAVPYRHRAVPHQPPVNKMVIQMNSKLDPGKSYGFDLPHALPKINAQFMPRRKTLPLVTPSVVGKEMSLVPQSSIDSTDGPSDEDQKSILVEDTSASESVELSLPRLPVGQDSMSTIVTLSIQEQTEFIKAHAATLELGDSMVGDRNTTMALDMVQRANEDSLSESDFVNSFASASLQVPNFEANFEPSEQSENSMHAIFPLRPKTDTSAAQSRTDKATYSLPKKKPWKPSRKSKGDHRRLRDEPMLFGFRRLGCSSSLLPVDLSPSVRLDDDDYMDKYCLRALLTNYVARCPCSIPKDAKRDAVEAARKDFNSMVKRKQVLDESSYENFARTCPLVDRTHLYKKEASAGSFGPSRLSTSVSKPEDFKSSNR